MNSSSTIKGFTLLELLIAISIFSVMATIAYGGIKLVIDGGQQLERAADELSSLQRTFLLIQQDIEQIVPRGIRDEFGSQEPAFLCCSDEKLLQLTRGGVRGVLTGWSDLRRVEYHLDEGKLERRVWSTLDRVQDSKPSRLQLLGDVKSIEITFLGYDDAEWQTSIQPESIKNISAVPRAIEVTITTERYENISRIFVVGS